MMMISSKSVCDLRQKQRQLLLLLLLLFLLPKSSLTHPLHTLMQDIISVSDQAVITTSDFQLGLGKGKGSAGDESYLILLMNFRW